MASADNFTQKLLPGIAGIFLRRGVGTGQAHAEAQWLAQHSKFGAYKDGSNPVGWEMVIVSAVLRCGLLSVKRVVALARALADPQKHFGRSLIRGYADLGLLPHGGIEEVVRWYPNHRLLLLISRVSPSIVKEALTRCSRAEATASTRDRRIAQVIFDGIVAEFRFRDVDPGLLPRSLSYFVTTIAQDLRDEFPSTLIDYASGRVHGPSFLPGSAGRINNESSVYKPLTPKSQAADQPNELPDLREAYAQNTRQQEPKWMLRLRAAFSEADAKQTLQAISAIERSQKTTPSGRQLCTLAKKLLTGPAYSGNPWSFSSIRCCILTIARRFALHREDDDPAKYSRTTLQELYRLVIDQSAEGSVSPQRLRRTVAWTLRQYHRHLVAAYGAPTIDEDIALRVASGPDRADAYVLSIEEIFKALEYIEVSRNRKWKKLYRTVARGQIVLDFLGSLRRAEGFGLVPSDLLPGPFCEVIVRGNDNRGLKTENAYRRALLGILAHPFPELLDPVHELFHRSRTT